MLAFSAGIMLTVVVEEIIPEAHKEEAARLATACLIGGFTLFALLAIYFG